MKYYIYSFNCLLAGLITLLLTGATTSRAQTSGQEEFRLFFSRTFPGSIPEYFEVEISSSGAARYREDHPEGEALEFKLSGEDMLRLTGRVKNLDYFRVSPAHSRKVAFTGEKIFRYVDAAGNSSETKFNYTENPHAQALLHWFFKAGETARHRTELERAARYDRLGVNQHLLRFQVSLDKGRIISPKQMIPILTRISKDKKIIHIARSRAALLVERIERGTGD